MIRWSEDELEQHHEGEYPPAGDSQDLFDGEFNDAGSTDPYADEPKRKKENHFGPVFLYQATLCIAIAVIMVLLNTFYPSAYSSIDRYLKEELTQITVDFQKDGEQVLETLQAMFNKLPAAHPDKQVNSTPSGSASSSSDETSQPSDSSSQPSTVSSSSAADAGSPQP